LIGHRLVQRVHPELEVADQLEARDREAIVGGQAARVEPKRRPAGPRIHHRHRIGARGNKGLDPLETHRPWPPRHLQPQQVSGRARAGIGAHDLVFKDFELLDRQCLDAEVERPRFAGGGDPRLDQPQKLVEDRVLNLDPQGEDAIEPALDRRQILTKRAALGLEPQPGQLLEPLKSDR
jgi:hypothetical protein